MSFNNYEEIKSKVVNILREVSIFSEGKLEMILGEKVDEGIVGAFDRLVESICYDRAYCRLLRADYVRLPLDDVKKIKVAALYLARLNPEMVLPAL